MGGAKRVLILTDGTERVKKMAEDIAIVLKGNSILLKDASAFAGNDLLPAKVLFFGCEDPSPPSFGYFEILLQHINLAGRFLGVFSHNSIEAVQYLARMAKKSDVSLCPKPFFAKNSKDLEKWATIVLTGKY